MHTSATQAVLGAAVGLLIAARSDAEPRDRDDGPIADREAARQVVERAILEYRKLETYSYTSVAEYRFEIEAPPEMPLPPERTQRRTFAFAAPDLFVLRQEPYEVISDGTTVYVYNRDLNQYVESRREEIQGSLEAWLKDLTNRQLSLPFGAEVLLDRTVSLEDAIDDLTEFVGVRSEVRDGRPGQWVVTRVRDSWYRSGEEYEIQIWFDDETGLVEAARGDFTDAYQFAMSISQRWSGGDDEATGAIVVKSATWSSAVSEVVTNGDLPGETFAFTPADTDRRVDRFEQPRAPTFSRADQLRLIGRAAPDFRGNTLDGKEIELADLRGHVVLMDFWATWCGPCVRAIPHIQAVAERFAETEVTVLGINRDVPGSDRAVRRFVENKGITFEQVMDTDGSIAGRYLVSGIPATVLIDREGVIQDISVGFAPDHERHLIEQIDTLLEGRDVMDTAAINARIKDAAKEHDLAFRFRSESPELLALVGKPAPAIEAPDLEGRKLAPEDLRDRVALLYFWLRLPDGQNNRPTSGDRQMHRDVQRIADRFADDSFVAVGIFPDRWSFPEEIRTWMRDNGISLRQVADEGGDVAERFGVAAYPSFVLVDANRIVQDVRTGYSTQLQRQLTGQIERLMTGESLINEEELAIRREMAEDHGRRRGGALKGDRQLAVDTAAPDLLRSLGRLGGHSSGDAERIDLDGDGADELVLRGGSGMVIVVSSDGSSTKRIRLRGPSRSAQLMELEPVSLGGEIHWFASMMDWNDPERSSSIGLYAPDGEPLWQFEPPDAIVELEQGERVSTMSKLAAADLNADGEIELLVGVSYTRWKSLGVGNMGSVGSGMAGFLFVLDRNGTVVSQTDIGGTFSLLEVIPPISPDERPIVLAGSTGDLVRYQLDLPPGVQQEAPP